MMAERGILLAHMTILRWVQRYVPDFEKRWQAYARPVSEARSAGQDDGSHATQQTGSCGWKNCSALFGLTDHKSLTGGTRTFSMS